MELPVSDSYWGYILSAYVLTGLALLALTCWVMMASRRAKRRLAALEPEPLKSQPSQSQAFTSGKAHDA